MVRVHASAAGHVGWRLEGLAHVPQHELIAPDLAGAVAQHVVAAARSVGFVPGVGASTLDVQLPVFEVRTAGMLAGSSAQAWLRGSIALLDGSGQEVYRAEIEGRDMESENNSTDLGFALLDQAVEGWFVGLREAMAAHPELVARLDALPSPTSAGDGISSERDAPPEGLVRARASRSHRPGRVFLSVALGWLVGNAFVAGTWVIKSLACGEWRVGANLDGSLGCALAYSLGSSVAQGVGAGIGVTWGGSMTHGMGGGWRTYLLGISGAFLGYTALPNSDEDGRIATQLDFDVAFAINAGLGAPMAVVGYEIDSARAEAHARQQTAVAWAPTWSPLVDRSGRLGGVTLGVVGRFF
ncbi:MAG: hypothetical protein GXP55_01245 [Deltaproteobacteria bacterium]|nr:hypothetical protein [Deltaproteobacteria bacterium]